MVTLGVNVAVLRDGAVLLTKREDFEVWCLPGGHVDPGESLAEAARREMREETGYEVALDHLVGFYSRPAWQDGFYHAALFTARIIGGEARLQTDEVIEMRFVPLNALPCHFLLGHRRRVLDAAAGRAGLLVTEHARWPFDPSLSGHDLRQLREQSGLTRSAFYARHFTPQEAAGTTDDLAPASP